MPADLTRLRADLNWLDGAKYADLVEDEVVLRRITAGGRALLDDHARIAAAVALGPDASADDVVREIAALSRRAEVAESDANAEHERAKEARTVAARARGLLGEGGDRA